METAAKSQTNWALACRICLKNSELDMRYIFDGLICSDDIVTKIIKCGGVPIDVMDGMPDRICNQCLLDLDVAYRFRCACQESYYQLRRLIDNEESVHEQCNLKGLTTVEDPEKSHTNYSDLTASRKQPNLYCEPVESLYLNEEELDEEFVQPTEEVEATVKIELSDSEDQVSTKDSLVSSSFQPGPKQKIELKKGRTIDPCSTFICYCCGNLYKSKSKLSQHIKLHSAEKPHECEICQKKFAQAAQLSRHMNSHTGKRPYKCNYCPSSFADPSTCIKHQRIHTNDRPFKCLECGKAFAYSNVLKVHQKIHTGEKPFSCSVCDKKFTQLHHKKSHERTHSGVDTTQTEDSSVEI